jgi:CxxC motif-containing protein (DUF1111 family)
LAFGICFLVLGICLFSQSRLVRAGEKDRDQLARGKELFSREWLPGDRRSQAGDGLGPLFNARSCAACHHLGGVGGAGPKHTNATIVSAFVEAPSSVGFWAMLFGAKPKPPEPVKQPERSKLAEIHPTLRTENSFPLHRFGTEPELAKWKRQLMLGQAIGDMEGVAAEQLEFANNNFANFSGFGGFLTSQTIDSTTIQLIPSERNAPSLFGAGIIDRIPEKALTDVATAQAQAAQKGGSVLKSLSAIAKDPPLPVMGRVARLKDGRVGRFGWKGQTATLREFTLQACAIEIGLEVPGFPQTAPPWKADYKAPGLDLNADQCDALIGFVASLPSPCRKRPETEQHAAEIAAGQKLFERVGCAVCHQPKLGDVDGLYSDLLLHDMGQSLSDNGQYGGSIVAKEGGDGQIDPLPVVGGSEEAGAKKRKFGAGPREWRTPPLWGLRDTAPYLHDGRADTVAAAVAFHGGESLESAQQFQRLSLRERQQIELFLQSLTLPERIADTGSVSAYFGNVHIILTIACDGAAPRRVRLHPESSWTMTGTARASDRLANKLERWKRDQPSRPPPPAPTAHGQEATL